MANAGLAWRPTTHAPANTQRHVGTAGADAGVQDTRLPESQAPPRSRRSARGAVEAECRVGAVG